MSLSCRRPRGPSIPTLWLLLATLFLPWVGHAASLPWQRVATAPLGQSGPCPPTAAPVPGGPSGPVNTLRPTFTWSAVAGATSYTLYVLDPQENWVVRATDLTSTSFTPTTDLPAGIQLRWKVKGESACGPGPYSPSTYFTVQDPNAAPWVRITSPVQDSTVSGFVDVQADTATTATKVEFYVDGVYQATSTTRPFRYSWDTTRNPLPAPNHPIQLGYFFADGRYGDYLHEVAGHTNLYVAWARRGYEPDASAPDSVWLPLMRDAVARAASQGWNIQLNLNLQEEAAGRVTPVDAVLDLMAPYWNKVARIELADEPSWSRAETEQRIQDLRARLSARGLANKPMGNIYTRDQALTSDAIFASNMDFVGIEAYVEAPGSSVPQVNTNFLYDTVTRAKQRVPTSKQIVLVMQAYARNGNWTNMDTLRDLQPATYLMAFNDPRVVAVTMFSYGRPSGTREHPELKPSHLRIAEKLFNTRIGGATCGRRMLTAAAYDAQGRGSLHNVVVNMGGPDCGGPPSEPPMWTNPVKVSVTGGTLTKTGLPAWDGGAVSTKQLSGDGAVEVKVGSLNSYRAFGLGNGDTSASYIDIEFGVILGNGGALHVYEGGSNRGVFGTYAVGDLIRVAVESGRVRYYRNGVRFYESTLTPAFPLRVDTSLYETGATLSDVALIGPWQ